jgi:hypothetical protein
LLAKVEEETAELVAAAEAREKQQQIPFGNDNQKGKSKRQLLAINCLSHPSHKNKSVARMGHPG